MNTLSTAETLPWLFTGAHPSLDGKYAIGAIVSEKIGGAVVALSYDGHDMETNLTRLNEAGRFIVEKVNGADGQDCALQLTCAEAIARQIAIKDFAYSDAFTTPPSRSYVQVSKRTDQQQTSLLPKALPTPFLPPTRPSDPAADTPPPDLRARFVDALTEAFSEWLAENYNIVDGGGTGNVVQLFAALTAASAKACNSE